MSNTYFNRDMFPEGSKMPLTNLPVNSRGPVPRLTDMLNNYAK